jgi:predicted ABC-type ATPase
MSDLPGRRPILIAIAGPNGAGKTTFCHAHIAPSGLRYLDPDRIARELRLNPEGMAQATAALCQALMQAKESFAFETVFSDPMGDKLAFLKEAAASGYTAILCFIGLASPETSEERVAMRVSQGGHDVPPEKLIARYPRSMANLQKAIRDLPHVYIFDNEDLRTPFRKVAVFENGRPLFLSEPVPKWLAALLSAHQAT